MEGAVEHLKPNRGQRIDDRMNIGKFGCIISPHFMKGYDSTE